AAWIALACATAACSSDEPPPPITHIFDEITDSALPGEQPIPLDPTEWACDTICIGAQFGVGGAAAAVDGDGRIDLYLAGPNGGRLLLNRWPVFQPAPLGADGYVHGAAFGDLDGDGDPDLLLATATGLRVFENVNGQLQERTELRRTMSRTSSVTVGDLNN